ncbi:MAG TPA: hypothetical protein VIT01_19680, partial [Acidimicrobiales bacterium]
MSQRADATHAAELLLKIYTDAAPGPDGVSQDPLVLGAFDAEVPRPGSTLSVAALAASLTRTSTPPSTATYPCRIGRRFAQRDVGRDAVQQPMRSTSVAI